MNTNHTAPATKGSVELTTAEAPPRADGHGRRMTRWYRARRDPHTQVTMNCLDELRVIAEYRRSERTELLPGEDVWTIVR